MRKSDSNLFFPVIDLPATGQNIRRLRYGRKLSVQDLQDYFGFEMPQAVYRWESGRTLPTVDNLVALGKLLGILIDEIIVEREIAVVDIKGFSLIYIFRGHVCWVVYRRW